MLTRCEIVAGLLRGHVIDGWPGEGCEIGKAMEWDAMGSKRGWMMQMW